MKRNPGEWLRERLIERMIDVGLLATMGIGCLLGAGLALWLTCGAAPAREWTIWFALLPGAVCLGAAFYKATRTGGRSVDRWRLRDMRVGARAEENVGQAIEYALTRERCGVAHHVEEIARVGDIDHLVATPRRLWVIETKHGWIPGRKFPEALRRIAANVEAVRDWAPGTQVTGCLVFAGDREVRAQPTFERGMETIRCFTSATALMRELREEAHGEGPIGANLVRRVWTLAKAEGPLEASTSRGSTRSKEPDRKYRNPAERRASP